MTEVQTAQALYERVRRDSGFRLAPYRAVHFVARMMARDPLAVLVAIGLERVATDDKAKQK